MRLIFNLKNNQLLKKILFISVLFFTFSFSFVVFSFGESESLLHYSIYACLFLLSVATGLYCLLYKRLLFNNLVLVVFIFVIWSFIGTAIYSKEFRSWFSLVLLFISFVVFYHSFYIIRNKEVVLAIVALAFFVFSIYYFYIYRSELIHFRALIGSNTRLGSYFDNQNGVGSYATIGFATSLYLVFFSRSKVRFVFLLPVLTAFIVGVSTGSRTFIVTIFILLLTYLFFKFKNKKVLFLIILVCFFGLSIVILSLPFMTIIRERLLKSFGTFFGTGTRVDTSTVERTIWADCALVLGSKNLIFGYGADGFSIFSGVGTYSHSNFSELICNFGIFGCLAFYLPLILILGKNIVINKGDRPLIIAFIVYYLLISFSSVFYYKKIYYLILAFLFYESHLSFIEEKTENLVKTLRSVVFTCDSLSSGGAEKVLVCLANEMANRGIKVSILGVSDRNNGHPFYTLSSKVSYSTIIENNKYINPILRVRRLRRKIINESPDIVISFLPHINVYTYFALLKTKIPHIVSERNNPFKDPKGKILRILKMVAFHFSDGCVFQTQSALTYYGERVKHKSTIIKNPIQIPVISERQSEREKVVLFVGRFVEQKNIYLLLDAFKEFNKSFNDEFVLKLYGDGPLKKELNDYVIMNNIQTHVLFCGNDAEWQKKEYRDAMFVLTSNYEGMPNSLAEAMVLGIPCIATNCPLDGPKELIGDNERGLLVEMGNKKELVEAMKRIIIEKIDFSDKNNILLSELSVARITTTWLEFIKNLKKVNYE